MTWGLWLYFPSACCGFFALKKSIASARFEPMNFGFDGKHANHYTTEVTNIILNSHFISKLLNVIEPDKM
jgi:hypothetical protein